MEQLERRDTPATLVSPTAVTYQDIDGDNVTVTFSKPILTSGNVNAVMGFDGGEVAGSNTIRQQLQRIDLTAAGAPVAGTTIKTVAVRSRTTGGDGFAAVGEIVATGVDLASVTIDGDLGRIVAGDGMTRTTGLRALSVHSLGRFGASTGAASLKTTINGALGSLRVTGDMREAIVEVVGESDGRLGTVMIGGSLIGGDDYQSGLIWSDGNMGAVRIKGQILGGGGTGSGQLRSRAMLASVVVGGSVSGGGGDFSGLIAAQQFAGGVRIQGDVQGGDGRDSGEVFSYGGLPSVTVGGSVVGGSGDGSGRVISIGDMAAVAVNRNVGGGDGRFSGMILSQSNLGSVTIGGSVTSGTTAVNATIAADGAIRSLTIKGSLVGTAAHPVFITAREGMRTISVLSRVEFASILAGVDESGDPRNADARIGAVVVAGDWIASSLVAGASPGAGGLYGDADDAKLTGPYTRDEPDSVSRIDSVTIGGQVSGTMASAATGSGADHFGIVAEVIGAVKHNGSRLGLTAGLGNDDVLVGITGDVRIREI